MNGLFITFESVDGRLVFANHRAGLLEVIEPALVADEHALCDRSIDSSRIRGTGRGLPSGRIDRIDKALVRKEPKHFYVVDLGGDAKATWRQVDDRADSGKPCLQRSRIF